MQIVLRSSPCIPNVASTRGSHLVQSNDSASHHDDFRSTLRRWLDVVKKKNTDFGLKTDLQILLTPSARVVVAYT